MLRHNTHETYKVCITELEAFKLPPAKSLLQPLSFVVCLGLFSLAGLFVFYLLFTFPLTLQIDQIDLGSENISVILAPFFVRSKKQEHFG